MSKNISRLGRRAAATLAAPGQHQTLAAAAAAAAKPASAWPAARRRLHTHTAVAGAPAHTFDPSFPSPAPSRQNSWNGQAPYPSGDALALYSDLSLSNVSSSLTEAPLPNYGNQASTSAPSGSNGKSFAPFYRCPPNADGLLPLPRRRGHQTKSNTKHTPVLCLKNGASGIPKRSKTLADSPPVASTSQTTLEGQNSLKSVQVGEDAYFVRSDSLGVADGVGGWSGRKDADPALFSRLLMHYCVSELEKYDDIDEPAFLEYDKVDPIDVMQSASIQCLESARSQQLVGSSTALIAVLRRDVLRVANLGDCNCSRAFFCLYTKVSEVSRIIRGADYLFRSEEQQHAFNYPLQIGTSSKDTAKKDAQRFDVQVQKDDIVILSSDGLIDNLFEEDILEEVLRFSQPSLDFAAILESGVTPTTLPPQAAFSPQDISDALCRRAKAVCHDQLAVASPFQQKASEEGIYYTGGKPDDITVLVSVVGLLQDSEDRR